MELRVGCRRPVEEPIPGLKRYRIASKIIKGQGLGGTDGEWVVIEPVHRAIELLEQHTTTRATVSSCCPDSTSGSATCGSALG
jgi:hypothetical protein